MSSCSTAISTSSVTPCCRAALNSIPMSSRRWRPAHGVGSGGMPCIARRSMTIIPTDDKRDVADPQGQSMQPAVQCYFGYAPIFTHVERLVSGTRDSKAWNCQSSRSYSDQVLPALPDRTHTLDH
jgi:hypothetical protein